MFLSVQQEQAEGEVVLGWGAATPCPRALNRHALTPDFQEISSEPAFPENLASQEPESRTELIIVSSLSPP